MPLKLVLGPANSAKAGEIMTAYAAVAPRGAVLVVPTATDALHYRRELAAGGAVFGSVLTFSGLMLEVGWRAGVALARLTPHQREELLRRAVAGADLELLRESATRPGFRQAAGELIAELTRQLTSAPRFAAALRAWAEDDGSRQAYAAELSRIYLGYERELERSGRTDRDRYAWRALDALRAAPDRWGRDAVFFYGFDDLTRLERDAVETLSRVAGAAVTVSLNHEPGRPALAARAAVAAELRPLADEVLELPAQDTWYAPAARPSLHHLERNLFEPDPAALDPGDAVVLLEAGGERAEAELIAARVLAARQAGVPAAEIAIVCRSLTARGPLLRRVLGEYGVAAAGPLTVAFGHTPLGRALRGAARCALAGPGEAGAGDLLAYLRAPGWLEDPEVADRLEARLAREGVSTVAAARERLGWPLAELDELAAAAAPGEFLERLGRRLLAAPHRAAARVLDEREALDARALGALAAALAELSEIGLAPGPAPLLELLEGLEVPSGAEPGPGELVLAEPLGIRARRFRLVCVCGLQEGEFPLPGRGDPFLSDDHRFELAVASGLRLEPSEDSLDRERYLFYATVSRATEQVLISYASSDEEGNPALASVFIDDLTELFGPAWRERRDRRLLADVVWSANAAPTERERRRALAAARAPVAGEPVEPERRLGPLAVSRLRHVEVLSAGALESYGECPVKWLVESELRPEPLAPEAEPLLRGNVIHSTLEHLIDQLGGPVTPENLRDAERGLPAALAGAAQRAGVKLGAGRPELVRAGLLRAIEADLRRYLRHEAGSGVRWANHGLELRFGFEAADEDSLPALQLGYGPEGIRLRGMIDRLDTDGAGHAVVRDYKSGAPRDDWPVARWASDQRLQVAIYLLAVRELTELEPVAGFYQPLRGDDLRGRGVHLAGVQLGSAVSPKDARSPEEFTAELQDTSERALALAAALRAGWVTPCPQSCGRDGCAHPGICRSQ